MASTVLGTHGSGIHSARPAGNTVPDGSLYSCTTHSLVYVSSYGGNSWATWATLGSAGSVGVDSIWDAAGDLAVGSGADTAAKLTKGSAGAVLAMSNGAVSWNAGTSFPGSPATNDRYWRTDLAMEFYYDGTRWLSTQIFEKQMLPHNGATTSTSVGDLFGNITATSAFNLRALAPSLHGGSDVWIIDYRMTFIVEGGGTALDGSNKWVATFLGVDLNGSSLGTIATTTINSGSSSVRRVSTVTVGALAPSGTVYYVVTWTKTGTPGNLETGEAYSYRIVAT